MAKSTAASATCLAVMARYPEPGTVKSRLARALGAEMSCDFYRAFLRDIRDRFGRRLQPLIWFYQPPERDFGAYIGGESVCLPQRGDDLGERMHDAFQRLLSPPFGFAKVLMIGADVPHVPLAWLEQAEQMLDSADVVLGPSADGGYYLIGMTAVHDLFSGIAMGTDRVLTETRARATTLGLTIAQLPLWFDLDEVGDLERLAVEIVGGGIALPATEAMLRVLSRDDEDGRDN